uniref:A-kinase anchoring protein 6 n=1 Tax=Takifugu rubripes TaxID=31033 RepID=A0A674ML43_TAKRU
MSRSTPSLMDAPDRTRFWLDLDSVYPDNMSHSCENLQVLNRRNLQNLSRHAGGPPQSQSDPRSSGPTTQGPLLLEEPAPQDVTAKQMNGTGEEAHGLSEGDSDSSAPSPIRNQYFSSDMEASGEESDPRPPPGKTAVWILKRQGQKQGAHVLPKTSPGRQHWYGSEEFLALPAQLHETEMLALKLESLAQSVPLGRGDSTHEALQDVDDWDLMEVNPDCDLADGNASSPPPLPFPYRRNLSQFSSASSSDFGPSLDGSIESGRLSDLQSDEDEGRRSADRYLQVTAPPLARRGGASVAAQLLEDVQSWDTDPDVWRRMECLVLQLDGFISWLQEALDSTENWTQPRQDVDSLRAYLDTHLSFKWNVDSRGALKDNIMEEGSALLSVITSHQSGLKDILHMVSNQWDQLQRQIRRQHSWMLRALRCIQSRLLYTHPQSHEPFVTAGEAAANQTPPHPPDSLMVELVSSQHEAQRAALEQMAVRMSSLEYPSSANRRHCTQYARNNSLQQFESEYQELWDWLMDMDAMVTDSHQLMMSEEQRHQLYKSSHVELTMMEAKKTSLLSRAEALKRSQNGLPGNLHHKIHNLTHTWKQLEKILSEHSGSGSQRTQSANPKSSLLEVHRDVLENPRSSLSPLTNALLEQLEARIKELKVWLRDTELLIFNSCLREHKDAAQQLQSFKGLCSEVRARRRGVSSVLKLCQKLLQAGPPAEVGPEGEQHREALQLLSINLERRWEAIVMQALQWQNRLKRELGEQQVPGNFLEPGLVDLHKMSPIPAGPVAHLQDDSWEWDETDMTITEVEPQEVPDLMHNLPSEPSAQPEEAAGSTLEAHSGSDPMARNPPSKNVLQVYSLHSVELYRQPPLAEGSSLWHKSDKQKQHLLLKSMSKDSSFSSFESLPDLLGGSSDCRGDGNLRLCDGERKGSGQSASSQRSESESGIVSDTGDTETTATNKENNGSPDEDMSKHRKVRSEEKMKEKVWRRDERRRHRRGGGAAAELFINGRGTFESPSDYDLGGDQFRASSPLMSQASSLESILAPGEELFPSKDLLHRSASLESCLLLPRSSDGDTEAGLGEQGDGDPGRQSKNESAEAECSSGELSRRTLDLLKRLENIQTPLATTMTRSVSDMTLQSTSTRRNRLPPSPSLGGSSLRRIPGSSRKEPPRVIQESSASASLVELSSADDSSVGSDRFTVPRNQHLVVPNAGGNGNFVSYRKPCQGSRRGGVDEADAASVSLLVNVSSTCTDEDEDDSDLLSSSTLTLTEEELGLQEDEEEGISSSSSGNEEEEEMEGSYVLGLDYLKTELQSFIRSPHVSSSKPDSSLRDELQCGASLSSTSSTQRSDQQPFLHASVAPATKSNTEHRNKLAKNHTENPKNHSNVARSYISRFVDDVENGNVEQSGFKRKDEDDELLREESSVFTKKGEVVREESYVFPRTGELPADVHSCVSKPESQVLRPFIHRRSSSLVGQLKGELPCHSSSLPTPPSLSPMEDHRSHDALQKNGPLASGRKAITIQEKFKFSSFVLEETKREVREVGSSLPPKKRHSSHPSCCSHLPPPSPLQPPSVGEGKKEDVHNFVMEIIDMTSTALRTKGGQTEEPNQDGRAAPDQAPAPLTQIRDKVLEHSHRPLHLRKGDFYSYLSLSSHDSDCGEVTQCSEDKSSTPTPYSIPVYATPTQGLHSPNPETFTSARRQTTASRTARHPESPGNPDGPPLSPEVRDEETLFPACTEEVYLGPPLCYSVSLTKKPRRLLTEKDSSQASHGPDARSRSDPERPWSEGTPSSPDVSPRPPAPLQDSSLPSTSVSSDCSSLRGAPDTPSAIFNDAAAERRETTCCGIRSLQDASLRGLS